MDEKMIFEGNTTAEAIEKGLKELKVSKKDVEIKVLDEDKKSFFDILAPRVVKVEIKIKEKKEEKVNKIKKEEKELSKEELEKAQENLNKFLEDFISKIDNEIFYEIKVENGNTISVEINGEASKSLIGYRGEALNALQTILIIVAGKNLKDRIHVNVDILGYREKRRKVLEDLAERIARNVMKTKKAVTLEPMTAYERKIIHTKLQDNEKLTTESIGEGEHRRVVISLK